MKKKTVTRKDLYYRIRQILESARANISRAVNSEMVRAYWLVGREIVEDEQKGRARAGYGEKLLENLSKRLTAEFGRGFDVTNLWKIKKFYLTFPLLDTVCLEVSWSREC